MSADRRKTDGHHEASKGLWNAYADELGLPEAGLATTDETFPRATDELKPPLPTKVTAKKHRSLVVALAVAAVAAIASTAAWLTHSPFSGSVERSPRAVTQRLPDTDPVPPVPSNQSAVTEVSGAVSPSIRGSSSALKQRRADMVYRIHFGFGSFVINDASRPTLDAIVAAMNTTSDLQLAIEGHTDARGTADYNQTLSERRADAVRAYLETAGIAPRRLRPVGFGASRPLVPNDGTGDDLNRRVELRLR